MEKQNLIITIGRQYGSGLKIRQYQREKKELLESLELYYRVVFLGDSLADLETEEETDA